ncbi:hypothetical protein [Caldisericum sp.]|uniref:hypothetical protein n=1 Tax=Caldisericum sp. TaxID=2499687 RepID=UPI003D0EFE45
MILTKDFIQDKLNLLEKKELEDVLLQARRNRASELGHPCLRYLYLLRTMPSEDIVKLQKLFRVGKFFEEIIVKRLIQILPVQAFQRPIEHKELQIAGVLDILLETKQPLEIKSCSYENFQEIQKYIDQPKSLKQADLLFRKYYFQVQTYLMLLNVEQGFLYVIDRQRGGETIIEITRDEPTIQEIIEKAERVNECVAKEVLPEGINQKNICSHCYFYKNICSKEFQNKKKVQVVNLSEDFIEKLDKYFVLQQQLKELKKLETEIKTKLHEWEDGIYTVKNRPYVINITEYERNCLELPEDLKQELMQQYGVKKLYKRIEIK